MPTRTGATSPQGIVNFPTVAYTPDAPDKHKIDPHSGVIRFDWTLRDG